MEGSPTHPIGCARPDVTALAALRCVQDSASRGGSSLDDEETVGVPSLRSLRSLRPHAKATKSGTSAVLEVLNQDHVRVARAKGLPEPMVLRKHVLNPQIRLE